MENLIILDLSSLFMYLTKKILIFSYICANDEIKLADAQK